MENKGFRHDFETSQAIAEDIIEVVNLGIQVCVSSRWEYLYRGIDASLHKNRKNSS